MPNEGLRKAAAGRILSGYRTGEPLSTADALHVLSHEFQLSLSGVVFSTKDADLVPDTPSCTDCEKRSGNLDTDLFGDLKSKAVCLDPICFGQKARAAWKVRAKKAKDAGERVLTADEARTVASGTNTNWTLVDSAIYRGSDRTTAREVVKKAGAEIPIAIGLDVDSGQVLRCYPASTIRKLLKAKSGSKKRQGGVAKATETESQIEAKRQKEATLHAYESCISALVGGVESGVFGDALARSTLEFVALNAPGPALDMVAARRGVKFGDLLKVSGPDDGLLAELVLATALVQSDMSEGVPDDVQAAFLEYGLDPKKVRRNKLRDRKKK